MTHDQHDDINLRLRFADIEGEHIQDMTTINNIDEDAPNRWVHAASDDSDYSQVISLLPTEALIGIAIHRDDRDEAIKVVTDALNAWHESRGQIAVTSVTLRGFDMVAFNDDYGRPCSLQESSNALTRAVWLGQDGPNRMHLNRRHLGMLVGFLNRVIAGLPLLPPKHPTDDL